MAKFEKGHKMGRGRPKGAVNKTTAELKEMIVGIVGNQMGNWQTDLEKIRKNNPEEAIRLTAKLIDYVLPKQTKIDLEGELNHKVSKVVIEIKKNNDSKHSDNTDVRESAGKQE